MDPLLIQIRAILEIVRNDCDLDSRSENPMGGKHMALLCQAALEHEGIQSFPIYTQLAATRDGRIQFVMDVEVLELRLSAGPARMNMFGDIGDDAVPGLVRRWEEVMKKAYPGEPVVNSWHSLDPKRWAPNLPAGHFSEWAAMLLANAHGSTLDDQAPTVVPSSKSTPRL